jgi:translocator protein
MRTPFLFLLFLGVNFAALALCALLMGNPQTNVWYQTAEKAPWTPPGWVFGAAWTTIMILFSLFLSIVVQKVTNRRRFFTFYGINLTLIILWNPVFFQLHWVVCGTVILLASLVSLFFLQYKIPVRISKLLLVPYFLWLCIATSLNAYFMFI